MQAVTRLSCRSCVAFTGNPMANVHTSPGMTRVDAAFIVYLKDSNPRNKQWYEREMLI